MSRPVTALRALGLLAALAAVQGCAEQPQLVAATSSRRIYTADTQGGARECGTPAGTQALVADGTTEATLRVRNDGGWCGIFVAQPGPQPYAAGLLAQRPANGEVLVRAVGDRTRVDYFPNAGFAGSDAFAVRMVPGNATLRVAVTVDPGTAAIVPAAAAAPLPAAPAPARSSRRR